MISKTRNNEDLEEEKEKMYILKSDKENNEEHYGDVEQEDINEKDVVNNTENQVEESLNTVYGKQSNLEVPIDEMMMDFKDEDNQDKNEDNINPYKDVRSNKVC